MMRKASAHTGRLVVSLVSHKTDIIIRNYSCEAVIHLMGQLIEMCRAMHDRQNEDQGDLDLMSLNNSWEDVS
jgi:hypothetical protein